MLVPALGHRDDVTSTAPITATSSATERNAVLAAVVTAMPRDSLRSSSAGPPTGTWPASTAAPLTSASTSARSAPSPSRSQAVRTSLL